MLGRDEPIKSVPFFWTVQYGKSIRYTGEGKSSQFLQAPFIEYVF